MFSFLGIRNVAIECYHGERMIFGLICGRYLNHGSNDGTKKSMVYICFVIRTNLDHGSADKPGLDSTGLNQGLSSFL